MRITKVFTSSIRRKIFSSFAFVVVLVLAMVVISSYQLNQIRTIVEQTIPNLEETEQAQNFVLAATALDADLERFFVVGGSQNQEAVRQDLEDMTKALDQLAQISVDDDEMLIVQALEQVMMGLERDVLTLLALEEGALSSRDMNESIISVYSQLDEAKQIQQALATGTFAELRNAVGQQERITSAIIRQLLILGTAVLLLVVISSLFVTRSIVAPLLSLAQTASQIAEGDLDVQAEIETEEEVRVLAIAFNEMTARLRNLIGSLEQRVANRTKALATSGEVSRQLSTITNLDELLTEVVNQVQDAFGYYYAQIYVYDVAEDRLLMAGGTGDAGQKMLAAGHKLNRGQGLVGRVAAAQKAVFIPDVAQEPSWLANEWLPDTKSEVAIPILLAGELFGVLDVQLDEVKGLDEENIELLQTIANQVAIAMQNARQYEQTQNALTESEELYALAEEQAQRLAALNVMSAAFGTAVNEEEIIQIIGDNLLKIIAGDRASIALIDSTREKAEISLLVGEYNANTDRQEVLLAQSAIGVAVREERLLRLPHDEPMENFGDSKHFMSRGFQSVMFVPLKAGGQILGTLNIGSTQAEAFQESDLRFVQQVASTIAINIEGKRLTARANLLASIVQNHPDFIGVGSFDGNAIYINPAGLEMMNFPLDMDVTQLKVRDRYSEEDMRLLMEVGVPTAMEAGSWSSEMGLKTADGQTVPVDETIGINYDASKNPVSFSITMRDIRERKEAEQTLQAAQARNEAVLQSIAVPMLIASVETGTILYANQHLADMAMSSVDALLDNETPNFYHNIEDRETVLEAMRTVGEITNFEVRLVRADGELLWGMLTARLFVFEGQPAVITTLIDVTDRIEAQVEIEKQAAELATVAEVSTAVSTTLDTQKLFQEIVDLTKERFQLYHAHIYLLSENGNRLRLVAGAGEAGDKMVAEGRQIPLSQKQSLVAQAARRRQGVVVNDVRAEAGFLPNPLLPETRAELATPMIIGGQLLGVLDIQADQVDYFTRADIDVQTTLASQVAAAIQNATQYQRAQDALEEVTRMQQLLVREGWESFMAEQEKGVQGYRYKQEKVQPIKRNGADKVSAIVDEGVDDTAVYSPLTVRGASIGTIGVRDASGQPVPEDKRQLLQSISIQVAEALERARLFEQTELSRLQTESALEETRRRTEELAHINQIVTDLGASLDVNDSMQIVADGIAESLGIEQCRIALVNEDGQAMTIVAEHFDPQKSTTALGFSIPIEGNLLSQQVLETREPVFVDDISSNLLVEPVRDLLEAQGIKGMLILPMLVGNEVLGTLGIDLLEEGQKLNVDQVELARTIIFQAATAVQNAKLYSQTQRRAEREQLVNSINQKIQSTTSVEDALQTAIAELGRALQAQNAHVNLQLNESSKNGSQ